MGYVGSVLIYGLPLAIAMLVYLRRRTHREALAADTFEEVRAAGLAAEPTSLHPVVDPNACIGSGSCTKACPEQALGIIDGKARLVNPAVCIGHGACMSACPVEAIKLVFGTEKRGVDIPNVGPTFESDVPGIFIAGELGGMGLIRKAAEQGRQAMEAIGKLDRGDNDFHVVIIGAGPAGISAGLGALQHRLSYALIEQEDSLGGAVYHYPRHKIAMTAPVHLPIVGKVKLGEISKEALLAFWQDVVRDTGLQIRFRERMERIEHRPDGFDLVTTSRTYRTRSVLLAIGRRGTPRKLGVPGEERSKVVYRLVDAAQYRDQNVLIVGGGDSALEAALAVSAEPGTTVTLSYRGDAFTRVKEKNRRQFEQARLSGTVAVVLNSNVLEIGPDRVLLERDGRPLEIRNDAVIVSAGGVLPTELLKQAGIGFETKYGTA
jgi:thioredoxin reductase/NAD-dependent dihydropyrimidine dehydrogenase PreA subunit